jgi:hypothetical protein
MEKESSEDGIRCAECGAPRVNGMTCWEQFGAVLAWEAHDAELLAEHFLTVASYNLQHPAQFTDYALANLREGLTAHLDHGTSVAELRRRAGRAFEGKRRVLKDEAERTPSLRPWTMTVADVYIPSEPSGAADRVRAWAASIRKEL